MANPQTTRIWTRPITTALVIDKEDLVQEISILVSSGTCTVVGNFEFAGEASAAITLSAGQSLTISSSNGQACLDGITITPVGGTTNVIAKF